MRKIKMLSLLLLTGLICSVMTWKMSAKAETNYACGTYFANWAMYNSNLQNMNVGMIPWSQVTYINHAFYKVNSSYTLVSTDSWADEQATFAHSDSWSTSPRLAGHLAEYRYYKTIYPNVKVLISIGGWTSGEYFHAMAATAANRAIFINSCISFLQTYPFIDGFDIDWEYPGVNRTADPNDSYDHGCPGGPGDAANFTALLKELRAAYNANNLSGKLITIAGPAGYEKIDLQQPDQYIQYIDWINVMSYDIHGAWETNTNLQSALYANPNDPSSTSPVDIMTKYNIDYTMQYYISKGIPASKLHMGIPFYSRGWKNVGSNGNNGLFASASGAPVGNIDNAASPGGQNTYPAILALESTSGYVKYRDAVNDEPYLYNASAGIFYTNDDPTSISNKCNYVKSKGLGGAFSWAIANDTPTFTLQTLLKSLLSSVTTSPTPTTSSSAQASATPTSTPSATVNPTATTTVTPLPTVTSSNTYPIWQPNTVYRVGDIVSYNGVNYKCIQAHTTLTGWEPPIVPALWQPI